MHDNKHLREYERTIELSKLISFFIEIEYNHVHAIVNGKRIREAGLSVPAQFNCYTLSKNHAEVLHAEMLKRKRQFLFFSLAVEDFNDRKHVQFVLTISVSSLGNLPINAAFKRSAFNKGRRPL